MTESTPLTPEQVRRTLGEFAEEILLNPAFQAAVLAELGPAFVQMLENATESFIRSMEAGVSAEANPITLRAASRAFREEARVMAQTLITRLTETELRKVGQVIADEIAQGRGPRQIAPRLLDVRGLDSVREAKLAKYVEYLESTGIPPDKVGALERRMFNSLLRDRRETIARTETAFATGTARREVAIERGAEYKSSISVGDSRVSEVCRINEAAGPIGIDKPYPGSGTMSVPHHPNCRCVDTYGTGPRMLEGMTERAAARAAATAEAAE